MLSVLTVVIGSVAYSSVVTGRVRILPEVVMEDPLMGARPASHYRTCFVRPVPTVIQSSIAVNRDGNYFKYSSPVRTRNVSIDFGILHNAKTRVLDEDRGT